MSEPIVHLTEAQLREMITATVQATLTSISIEGGDPLVMQKDFAWLREWRESAEEVKRKGLVVLVTFAVTGDRRCGVGRGQGRDGAAVRRRPPRYPPETSWPGDPKTRGASPVIRPTVCGEPCTNDGRH